MSSIKELPTKQPNLQEKTDIFEAIRVGRLPVINLKTGRTTSPDEGCPYNCLYCDSTSISARISHHFPGQEGYWQQINEEFFAELIENWAVQGGQILHWCGDGEPTTFKFFDLLLALSRKHNFRIELFSSLAGLTASRAQALIETNTVVKFKMDSRDPLTLGQIMHPNDDQASQYHKAMITLEKIDLLIETRNKYKSKSEQLIASIVISEMNHRRNKHDLIEVLEWCYQHQVIPQINYMEEIGNASQGKIQSIRQTETLAINRWLRSKFGLEPKEIMGDHCEAKAAPIIVGNKVFLGPFGMGCEFPLREHLEELHFIGQFQIGPKELAREINAFRFSRENLDAVIAELERIRDQQGIYTATGNDAVLPGCGDDIEELWFLEYVAIMFASEKYFQNFITCKVLAGKHTKWSAGEVNALINEVRDCSKTIRR